MALKNKLESAIKKFPTIAKIVGVKTYPEYNIPEPKEGDKALLQQYIADVNAAADKCHALTSEAISNTDENATHSERVAAYDLWELTNQKLQNFCIQHPELWSPGNDVAWFYDVDSLQERMNQIAAAESDYVNELINHGQELSDKMATTDAKDTETAIELANELEFTCELLLDAERTIGDKCNEIWWNAIPDVIKHKYAKIMDDSMVKLLAESDELTDYVLHFHSKTTDINQCRKFLKVLEKQMNKNLITFKPVRCLVAAKDDFKSTGEYDDTVKGSKVIVKYDCFKRGIDKVISTVKHEYFGHHVDNVAPNLGLQGESMSGFICHQFGNLKSHGGGKTHIQILKSPLLHTYYDLDDDVSLDSLMPLVLEGWTVWKIIEKIEYSAYRKRFNERAAFLVCETHDIENKVLEYRRAHGMPTVEKSR